MTENMRLYYHLIMAKKTVIKKCLKYAPLRSDILRAVSTDETIKSSISVDMSEVAPDEVAGEYEEMDSVPEGSTTGENE